MPRKRRETLAPEARFLIGEIRGKSLETRIFPMTYRGIRGCPANFPLHQSIERKKHKKKLLISNMTAIVKHLRNHKPPHKKKQPVIISEHQKKWKRILPLL